MARGRPRKEFDKKAFADLVGLGCTQEEICWYFRDENGKVANVDTLSRWCKRTFGSNFQEYYSKNGGMALKIRLRRNQFKLSEKSAAMAIFLGKNYLGQRDAIEQPNTEAIEKLEAILMAARENADKAGELEYINKDDIQQEAKRVHSEGE